MLRLEYTQGCDGGPKEASPQLQGPNPDRIGEKSLGSALAELCVELWGNLTTGRALARCIQL